jgi:hypothetical protein
MAVSLGQRRAGDARGGRRHEPGGGVRGGRRRSARSEDGRGAQGSDASPRSGARPKGTRRRAPPGRSRERGRRPGEPGSSWRGACGLPDGLRDAGVAFLGGAPGGELRADLLEIRAGRVRHRKTSMREMESRYDGQQGRSRRTAESTLQPRGLTHSDLPRGYPRARASSRAGRLRAWRPDSGCPRKRTGMHARSWAVPPWLSRMIFLSVVSPIRIP